jgi:hypothetical protein
MQKKGLAAQKRDRKNKLSVATIPLPSPQVKSGRSSFLSWACDWGSSALPYPTES